MLRIRRIEEAISDQYTLQKMKCPVHLSIGQEAIAVGIANALNNEDVIFSNHRCHAHYLAKGGNLRRMIAELHGKQTGCCGGRGGSMHLADRERGVMGASALVGGAIPLAVGAALAFSLGDVPQVAVCFLGDGASEEGIFWESVNFSALKRLPVIFVCENNAYATYSHISARQANPKIADKVRSFGVISHCIDGNDVDEVFLTAGEAVQRAREGRGPTFLEALTYRMKDHVGPQRDAELVHRDAEVVKFWEAKCPVATARGKLSEAGIISAGMWEAFEQNIAAEIADAFQFSENSPFPDDKTLTENVYA